MANYNNYGFQPFPNYPSYPNYQQNNTQLNQYAFVNGLEGAKSYQLAPNQTMLLMDINSPVVFKKTANNVGQSTIDYYKLVQIKEQDARAIMDPQQPNDNYASKSDFNALNKRIDDLINSLTKVQKTKGNEAQN